MIRAEINQSRLRGGQKLPERLVVKTLNEIFKVLQRQAVISTGGRSTAGAERSFDSQGSLRMTKSHYLKKDVTISVAFVSEPEMKKLNRIWRGKNRVTDVLSFELEEGKVFGEILICYEQAVRQAKEMKHSTHDEIIFLLVHGVLHLFGNDHERPVDAKKMFLLQSRILIALGVDARL